MTAREQDIFLGEIPWDWEGRVIDGGVPVLHNSCSELDRGRENQVVDSLYESHRFDYYQPPDSGLRCEPGRRLSEPRY
jgi:hypothetical protein